MTFLLATSFGDACFPTTTCKNNQKFLQTLQLGFMDSDDGAQFSFLLSMQHGGMGMKSSGFLSVQNMMSNQVRFHELPWSNVQ